MALSNTSLTLQIECHSKGESSDNVHKGGGVGESTGGVAGGRGGVEVAKGGWGECG